MMNCVATKNGVMKRQIFSWWCYSNKLMPFDWRETDEMRGFDGLCMDAPDWIPAGGMRSLPMFGRAVLAVERGAWVTDEQIAEREYVRRIDAET